jgi:hypothetical protein
MQDQSATHGRGLPRDHVVVAATRPLADGNPNSAPPASHVPPLLPCCVGGTTVDLGDFCICDRTEHEVSDTSRWWRCSVLLLAR